MSLLDTYVKLQGLRQQQEAQQLQQVHSILYLADAAQKIRGMQQEEQANQALANVSPDVVTERPSQGIIGMDEGYDVPDPTQMITERTPKPDEQYYGEAFEAVKPISMKHALPFLMAKRGAVKERITKEEEARKNPMLTSEQLTGKAPLPMMPASTAYHYKEKEKEAKAPTTRHYTRGNEEITEEYDAEQKKWIPVANAPRYKPDTGASGLPKPPKDFRYTADGELEPIPGGKEDTKQRKQYAGDKGRVDNITKTLAELKTKARELKKNPALSKVVGVQGVVFDFPGGKAADARKALDQIRNRIMVDTLKAMKELSANGAAGFGQLTEKEGTRLEQYITTLDNAQSHKAIVKALGDVEDYATYLTDNLRTTFDESYDERAHTRYGKARSGGTTAPQQPTSTPRFKILKVE
jgi:hypothetical protein